MAHPLSEPQGNGALGSRGAESAGKAGGPASLLGTKVLSRGQPLSSPPEGPGEGNPEFR